MRMYLDPKVIPTSVDDHPEGLTHPLVQLRQAKRRHLDSFVKAQQDSHPNHSTISSEHHVLLRNQPQQEKQVECDPSLDNADLGILSCDWDQECVQADDSSLGGFCMDQVENPQERDLALVDYLTCDYSSSQSLCYCDDNRNSNGVGHITCSDCYNCYCVAGYYLQRPDGSFLFSYCWRTTGYDIVCAAYTWPAEDQPAVDCAFAINNFDCACDIAFCTSSSPYYSGPGSYYYSLSCDTPSHKFSVNGCYDNFDSALAVPDTHGGSCSGTPDASSFASQVNFPMPSFLGSGNNNNNNNNPGSNNNQGNNTAPQRPKVTATVEEQSGHASTGAVVGGVLGALFAIGLAAGGVVFFLNRKAKPVAEEPPQETDKEQPEPTPAAEESLSVQPDGTVVKERRIPQATRPSSEFEGNFHWCTLRYYCMGKTAAVSN